jgi:CheY-like chemotaxis protein
MITELKRRDVALIVHDSPQTLRLLTDALDGADMTVMVALDGAAAMRIVDQITPDIILLDAIMPGMDGFETCRRLKRETAPQRQRSRPTRRDGIHSAPSLRKLRSNEDAQALAAPVSHQKRPEQDATNAIQPKRKRGDVGRSRMPMDRTRRINIPP